MKRNILIVCIALITLILANLFLFRSLYRVEINQHKNLLFKEAEVCTQEVERVVQRFESDLNYILFSDDISSLFKEESIASEGLRKIELFYSTYNSLIENIDIYDNEKNVLNVFRDTKKNFIKDKYIAQRQRKLVNQEEVIASNSSFQYILPVFKNNELLANVLVTIDIHTYILSELRKFHLEGYTWQWVADIDNQTFYNAQNFKFSYFEKSEDILSHLAKDLEGLEIHTVKNDSLSFKLLSVYSPISILNKQFGIALSVDYKIFQDNVFSSLFIVCLISLIMFTGISIYLLLQIRTLKKKTQA